MIITHSSHPHRQQYFHNPKKALQRKFAVVLVNSLIVPTLLFQTPLLFYNGSIVLGALDVVPRSPVSHHCLYGWSAETAEGNKLRKMLGSRQSQMPKLPAKPYETILWEWHEDRALFFPCTCMWLDGCVCADGELCEHFCAIMCACTLYTYSRVVCVLGSYIGWHGTHMWSSHAHHVVLSVKYAHQSISKSQSSGCIHVFSVYGKTDRNTVQTVPIKFKGWFVPSPPLLEHSSWAAIN